LVLAVDDVDVARDDLIARGVKVSEVFHFTGGPFNNTGENPRVGGRDPQGRSYYSFASLRIQTKRLATPGDHDAASGPRMEVDASTSHGRRNRGRASSRDGRHHGTYEKTHAKHHWWTGTRRT